MTKASIQSYYTSRIDNCDNCWQDIEKHKRVLCVCSAGLLRSPTAAVVLSQEPFHFNTRAAGVEKKYALIAVDQVLLTWADEIVCMTEHHANLLADMLEELKLKKPILCLGIPDSYCYRDTQLMKLIKKKYLDTVKDVAVDSSG